MKNLMKKIRKSNKGFTLVELIIVIAIIAILTAVAAPQYIKYVDKSRWSKDQNEAASLLTVVQSAVIDKNSDNDTTNDIKGASGTPVTVTFTASGITTTNTALQTEIVTAFGDSFSGNVNDVIVVTNQHAAQPTLSSTYTVSIDVNGAVTGEWTA